MWPIVVVLVIVAIWFLMKPASSSDGVYEYTFDNNVHTLAVLAPDAFEIRGAFPRGHLSEWQAFVKKGHKNIGYRQEGGKTYLGDKGLYLHKKDGWKVFLPRIGDFPVTKLA